MIEEIVIPEIGATGGEVKVVEWLAQEGDKVSAGQPLFSIETDKAVVEVEAFRGGYLRKILVKAEAEIEPGTAVALIADSEDEPLDSLPRPAPGKRKEPGATALPSAAGQPRLAAGPATGRIMASPLARTTAKKLGIDLATVRGTGQDGHVRQEDVVKAAGGAPAPRAAAPIMGTTRTPASPMRKAIAARTSLSKRQAPHFYVSVDIDMAQAEQARRAAAATAERQGWAKPTVTAFIVRAAALALRETPQLNASYQDDTIVAYGQVNIGLVVGTADGMLAPVIHRADEQDLQALAGRIRALQAKVKAGQLGAHELAGSTLTISNLGMHGIDRFIAVINPPEGAMLALGAIRPRPAVVDGAVVPRPLMTATLSADHRLVDGITAAQFLGRVKDLLENPAELAAAAKG